MIALILVVTVMPVSAGDGVTRYWGVISGISDYQNVSDLDFCTDDANSVYNLLLLDSRWSASRITLLQDSQATRLGIENAISTMASNSDDDDICLFFFSGHGGQANLDFSPIDETDGKDEYLVCWDSNSSDYSGDYMDDDMGITLGLISGTTVVMLDSCHSGGHLKAVSKEESSEKIPVPRKIKFVRKPFELATGAVNVGDGFASDLVDRTNNLKDAGDQSDIIILTACDDDETSAENGILRHGEFTYFLLLGLKSNDENSNGHVSAEESFAYLDPALSEYTRSAYHPQLYDGASGEIGLVQPTAGRMAFIGHGDFVFVYPVNTYYQKRRAEYIYSQSQLGGEGLVMALKIFVVKKPPLPLENCTIRIQHTTEGSYSSSPQWTSSGWATVYSGTKTIENEGPVSFVLSTPFQYDGTRNLILDFSFSNPSWSDDESSFAGSDADYTYPMIHHTRDDDNYGVPTTWTGTSPAPIRYENGLVGSYLDLELEFSAPDAAEIPTLSEWGMIIFFISLVGTALWVMRRRTKQESV